MWPALVRVFKTKGGEMITAILIWLGVGLAVHTLAVGPTLDALQTMAQGAGSQAGSVASQWLGFLNFDKAVTMVLSAYAARQSVRAGKAFLKKR